MKIMLNIWILFGALATVVISQNTFDSDHLIQHTHYDSGEESYHPSNRRHQRLSYEPKTHEDEPSTDTRHYQSLEPRYHKREPEPYARTHQYHVVPQQVQYHQPEDPSYHRPQEIVYHQTPEHYQPENPTYHRPQEIVYHQAPQHQKEVVPEHQESYERSTHQLQPEEKEDPKYTSEEPKYVPPLRPIHKSHPAPIPTDPKLPLYFTMYEKRVVQDPVHKYGKGPWRYLTYGHGITYGSKEPGKVFEKGYGYIRALGRDHCKLPEHLCPSRDNKPFDYEGRKEPYFGYRPH